MDKLISSEKLIHDLSGIRDTLPDIFLKNVMSAAISCVEKQPAAEERRWIPVTEQLPENGQKVVFFNYGADAVYAGKFNYIGKKGTVWFRSGKTSYPGSYWMPLPEPPAEDS